MRLEEHSGSDSFVMSGWRGILVFSEIKWKDSKWSSNANVVSIMHVEGGVVIGRAWEMLLFQAQEIKGQRQQVTLEKENARPYLAQAGCGALWLDPGANPGLWNHS